MKWPLLFFLFLFSSSTMAQLERTDIENILPAELVKTLQEKKVSKVEEALKNKIYKKEADALYLNYFGRNGDVTLGVKDHQVTYLYVKIPAEIQKKTNLFDRAYDTLSEQEKKALNKKSSENTSHDKGRFTRIELPKKSMKLEFNNDEKRTLRSVILWPLGEKLP